MPHEHAPLLLALPLLLLASGFFSGSETALFGLTYSDRLRLKRASPAAAVAVNALLANPRALLITILLLNMTVNVLYFVLTSVVVLKSTPAVAVIINVTTLLALILFGEVLAKLVAGTYRIRFCRVVALPVLALHRTLGPLRLILDTFIVSPLIRLLVAETAAPGELTIDELGSLIEQAAQEGAIASDEEELLGEVVRLGTLRVRDVMLPRVDMIAVDIDASRNDVIELVRHSRLTHVPVRDPDADVDDPARAGAAEGAIVGILNTKRYLGTIASRASASVADHMSDVLFVPEQAGLDRLLERFQQRRSQLAIAVDEHGGVVGLVRVEDIAECLVAEVRADADHGPAGIQIVSFGHWSVPGRLRVREWTQVFGPDLMGQAVTIGGVVVALLGRMPDVGDVAHVGNVRFEVESLDGQAIDRVIVSIEDDDDTDAPQNADAPPPNPEATA